MTTRTGRRLATVLLGSATALLAFAAPAAAAPAGGGLDADVSVGRLVLDPTERGYRGDLPITVTNLGRVDTYFSVTIVEPVAGSIGNLSPDSPCGFQGLQDNRRVVNCLVPGPNLKPGERRTFSVAFQALTTPRDVAMTATGGQVSVNVGDGSPEVADGESFVARFRSTSGSLRNPVPYVQDSQARASITTAGAATLVRQEDGSYQGRLPVTVRWSGDAAHDFLYVDATSLPAGVAIWGTDPQDLPSFFTNFVVPGGRFMAGEERSFDVLLRAEPGTTAGDLGSVTFELSTRWDSIAVADADPADNAATFNVTAADAS
ncbi:hypothetical protein U2F26_18510 [Micromonospora sp. 4G57]|uniref:DUF11 domain-containing protein n=1 Tax=Micromonospora sicca TaxID=2202420 RepID=A0ABU5J7E2_9ACTN|nr:MULTISPECIES: hypothetical protein [unclassified Micromonospora]MDZ5444712.1 hypothetical protein [Micromonospora sp. 4G57]MDZ5488487.1 hypothetical protein [Micromonospora sp. 4G53]